MSKRAPWPMVVPAGTTVVGTARVRDDSRPVMTTAQRRIYELTGNPPQTSALDDVDDNDPFSPRLIVPLAPPAKQPKYRNTKCEHDGIKFDSQRERSHWFHLVEQQAKGLISDLRLQVPFEIVPAAVVGGKKKRARKYVADFVYRNAVGELVVEDVKGFLTPMYELKKQLMKTVHKIDIMEIK